MECTFAAVSDAAYLDPSTKKLYILGVFRYVFSKTVPAVHPQLAASFTLEEFNDQIKGPVFATVHLHNADGKDVIPPSPKFPLVFRSIGPNAVGRSLSQVCLELGNVQLPVFGDYAVLLIRDTGEVLARAKFTVHHKQQPAADAS